jgi:hypothetical protein
MRVIGSRIARADDGAGMAHRAPASLDHLAGLGEELGASIFRALNPKVK